MGTIRRFEDIYAWQSARRLVREIYTLCEEKNMCRDFTLRDQLCRAGISVMNNIAEGFGRHTDRDFSHFLSMALGSIYEIQSLLYVVQDLGRIDKQRFSGIYTLTDETASLIAALSLYLRKSIQQGRQR